jgi:hypothetical protein
MYSWCMLLVHISYDGDCCGMKNQLDSRKRKKNEVKAGAHATRCVIYSIRHKHDPALCLVKRNQATQNLHSISCKSLGVYFLSLNCKDGLH